MSQQAGYIGEYRSVSSTDATVMVAGRITLEPIEKNNQRNEFIAFKRRLQRTNTGQ